jgi:hypothetical protein
MPRDNSAKPLKNSLRDKTSLLPNATPSAARCHTQAVDDSTATKVHTEGRVLLNATPYNPTRTDVGDRQLQAEGQGPAIWVPTRGKQHHAAGLPARGGAGRRGAFIPAGVAAGTVASLGVRGPEGYFGVCSMT